LTAFACADFTLAAIIAAIATTVTITLTTALAVAFPTAFAVVVTWATVLMGAATAISISSATGTSALAIVSPAIGCFV